MKHLKSLSLAFLTLTSPIHAEELEQRKPEVILCDISQELGDVWLEYNNEYIIKAGRGAFGRGGMPLVLVPSHIQEHIESVTTEMEALEMMGFTDREFEDYIDSERQISNLITELLDVIKGEKNTQTPVFSKCPEPLIG